MQKLNSQTRMFCKQCGSVKQSKHCNVCACETNTLFTKEFNETINLRAWLRNLMKSGERVGEKPRREIEQYVGNKDQNIISEFERLRKQGKPTKVIHRLWRRFGNTFKKIHEHEK